MVAKPVPTPREVLDLGGGTLFGGITRGSRVCIVKARRGLGVRVGLPQVLWVTGWTSAREAHGGWRVGTGGLREREPGSGPGHGNQVSSNLENLRRMVSGRREDEGGFF